MAGSIALFGSGEIASTGRRIHEKVLQKIGKNEIKVAIVSTPAGFQPNVKIVYEEVAQFFLDSLTNFHPQITMIYANNRNEADDQAIVDPVLEADYIFIGAGSPTYAVKNLSGTLLYRHLESSLHAGKSMGISSAAAIAFSNNALPVYEIYKVGTGLYWEQGLNLYADFIRPMTVIPHLNNKEGGAKTDTSFCFMGRDRFIKLREKLHADDFILGIDEHTGIVIDLSSKKGSVIGKGAVHLLKGQESVIPHGQELVI